MKTYDAVVVGGGHNGLVAGCYLARRGLAVLVLERRERGGGLCGEVEYFPGYRASIPNSPGSFAPPVVADLQLAAHGLRFVRPDPSLVFPFDPDRAFVGWRDPDRAHRELSRVSARDATAYQAFFARLEDFAGRLRLSVYASPPPLREIIADLTAADDQLLHTLLFGSVQDLLYEWFETEEVRALVGSIAAAAGMVTPASRGSLMQLLLRPLSAKAGGGAVAGHDPSRLRLRGSTGLPMGGMGGIARALVGSLRSAGGELRLQSPVSRILCHDDRAYGVALASGETIGARAVLSAINVRTTMRELLAGQWLAEPWLDQLPMRGSAFKIGIALAGPPRWRFGRGRADQLALSGCQFRIVPTLVAIQAAAADAWAGEPSATPLLWGLTPSLADPLLAPPGRHVMSINAFHAPFTLRTGRSWDQEKPVFGQRCLDLLARYLPELPDQIIDVRYWSPEDLAREYGLVDGDITHGEMLTQGMLGFRGGAPWSGYTTPVDGLYLCGASAWPGGFVTGLPGRNAARRVIADLVAA